MRVPNTAWAASLALLALACGTAGRQAPGPVRDARPRSWAFRNEEQWLLSEIASSIAATGAFARRPAKLDPSEWAIRIESVDEPQGTGASLQPLEARLAIGRTGGSRGVSIRDHLFSPASWAPFASALLPPRDPRLAGRLLPDIEMLEALLDLRATVLEEQSRRVSKALENDILDASAHEQAALVLGAFGLREAAGDFSDERQALSRMTAHLAVAQAVKGTVGFGLAGRYAEILLLSLVQRQREAMDKIEEIEKASSSPTERAWLRALRLRTTGDWRQMPDTKGASLLERLERFRAYARRVSVDVASHELNARAVEPLPDWGRITLGLQGSPDACARFGSSMVAMEMAEATRVLTLPGEPPPSTPTALVAALQDRPSPGGVHIGTEGRSVTILDRGLWGRFLERHLVHALYQEYTCLQAVYDLPEEAVAYAGRAREAFAGLPSFRLIGRELVHDTGAPDRGFREAIGLAEREPQRVTAAAWTALRQDRRYPQLMSTLPDEALWFSTGFPRGTAYDAEKRLHHMKALRVVRLEDKAAFRAIAPFDYWVVWAYIWKLCGEKPVPEVVERESGQLLEYDARLLRAMARTWQSDITLYKAVGPKLCALAPDEWPTYAWQLLELGDEAGAVAAYREMLRKTPDEVLISNNVAWLVDYELAQGHRAEALRLAKRADATGSAGGIYSLGHVLERLGRLEDAFQQMRRLQERYNMRIDMLTLYLRHRDHFKDSEIEVHVLPVLKDVFGNDLEPVRLSDFRGHPKDGVLLNGTSERLTAAGLKQGTVIVALDGIRVRNFEQYQCVRFRTEDPRMRVIAWQDGRYVEVAPTLKDRRFRVDMVDYAP